jgi:Flp pilus assembly protein TadD
VLAQHYRGVAQQQLAAGDARGAINEANRALRLDGRDLSTLYTKAAAAARLGDARAAQDTLLAAVRIEPGDFLTYALLGDLSVRRRDFARARVYYRQSLARNPREPSLQVLARDPRAAVRP